MSIVTAQAPAVRAGRSSAPSGTVLGGNSDAFTTRASKEENKYRQVGIADRSCWTGEPAKTGSPAADLQLNEGHLAGILDDSCVGDSCKGYCGLGVKSRRRRVWWGEVEEGEEGRERRGEEAEEAEKVTASIDFSQQYAKWRPPVEPWPSSRPAHLLGASSPHLSRQSVSGCSAALLQIASPRTIQVDDDAAARLTAAFYV